MRARILVEPYGGFDPSGTEVHCNNIVDNASYGVNKVGSETVDAHCNWWGNASGPYHNVTNTSGLGDRVRDNVYYDLWSNAQYPILGDVNNDCIADIQDIIIVALAFGSEPIDNPATPWNEAKNWNPVADLNGDNLIDIVDLIIVGVNFGKGFA